MLPINETRRAQKMPEPFEPRSTVPDLRIKVEIEQLRRKQAAGEKCDESTKPDRREWAQPGQGKENCRGQRDRSCPLSEGPSASGPNGRGNGQRADRNNEEDSHDRLTLSNGATKCSEQQDHSSVGGATPLSINGAHPLRLLMRSESQLQFGYGEAITSFAAFGR